MKHTLQTIMPYHLMLMIIIIETDPEIDNPRKSLWYLYNMEGKLVKSGYGRWCLKTASQRAFLNACQVARRYVRKCHPLFFGANDGKN